MPILWRTQLGLSRGNFNSRSRRGSECAYAYSLRECVCMHPHDPQAHVYDAGTHVRIHTHTPARPPAPPFLERETFRKGQYLFPSVKGTTGVYTYLTSFGSIITLCLFFIIFFLFLSCNSNTSIEYICPELSRLTHVRVRHAYICVYAYMRICVHPTRAGDMRIACVAGTCNTCSTCA